MNLKDFHVSKSTARRNPMLFGVGAMAPAVGEPNPKPALVKDVSRKPKRKDRLAIIVTIIACRHRILDSDNHIAGCKALRDAIADSLGIDDGSERIRFQYGQVQTAGPEGCIVLMQAL